MSGAGERDAARIAAGYNESDQEEDVFIMPYAHYSADEVAEQGEALFQRVIRSQVQTRTGEFVVMDIESGEFEVAADDLTATRQLLLRRPQAVVYGLRIGHPAAYRLGGFHPTERS